LWCGGCTSAQQALGGLRAYDLAGRAFAHLVYVVALIPFALSVWSNGDRTGITMKEALALTVHVVP
jgi:hypothetical protein